MVRVIGNGYRSAAAIVLCSLLVLQVESFDVAGSFRKLLQGLWGRSSKRDASTVGQLASTIISTDNAGDAIALCDYWRSLPQQAQKNLTNWCGPTDASGNYINATCSTSSGAWLGVTCKRDGPNAPERVSDLNLDNFFLGGGIIPASIGKLDSLTFLRLSGTGLQGTIPTSLESLTKLEQLWLGKNPSLSGTIPTRLGYLPKIRVLSMSSTGLSGAVPQSFCALSTIDLRLLSDPGLTCTPLCMATKSDWPFLRIGSISDTCTASPSSQPSLGPTEFPTLRPTLFPTDFPTLNPVSASPSQEPTEWPTTFKPTPVPSKRPSRVPTAEPTVEPTAEPTTPLPTLEPTLFPTSSAPTLLPSMSPTWAPFIQYGDEFVLCLYYNSLPPTGQSQLTNWCSIARSAVNNDYIPSACSSSTLGENVWTGVTCCMFDGRDRVCDVNLANLPLGPGSIPSNIGNLNALTYLNLENTGLAGTVPASLGSIRGLKQIWLRNNRQLTGLIPPGLIPRLPLPRLTNLLLSNTKLGFPVDPPLLATRIPDSFCNLEPSIALHTLQDSGLLCYPPCLNPQTFFNFKPGQPVCGTPTSTPTNFPSAEPTTSLPTIRPTMTPTVEPTTQPTTEPSFRPTPCPSAQPSHVPTTAMPTGNSMYSDASILCQFHRTLPAFGQANLKNWCTIDETKGAVPVDGDYLWPVCSRDGSSVNTWTGVTCCYFRGADRVCDINLNYKELGQGTLPDTIGGLDALTYLNLRRTGITGPIPWQLGTIRGIQQIWLSDNTALNSTLPSNFGTVMSLRQLDTLHLSNTALSGAVPRSFCSLNRGIDMRTMDDPKLSCYPPCLAPTVPMPNTFYNYRPGKLRKCSPPTASPTPRPSSTPSKIPTRRPTFQPSARPTRRPTALPTASPTRDSMESDGDILCCYWSTMEPEKRAKLTNWCGPKRNGVYINSTCADSARAWLGVTCQRKGPNEPDRVTDVNLVGLNLGGSLPACIGGLNKLTYLNVRSTSLGGSLPWELGTLTALRQLWIGDNQVMGTLPSSLALLSNLQNLYLSNTKQLTGSIPSALCSISGFATLDLRILGDSRAQGGQLLCYPPCLDQNVIIRKDPPTNLRVCPSPAPTPKPTDATATPTTPAPSFTVTNAPIPRVRTRIPVTNTPSSAPQALYVSSAQPSFSPNLITVPTATSSAPSPEPSLLATAAFSALLSFSPSASPPAPTPATVSPTMSQSQTPAQTQSLSQTPTQTQSLSQTPTQTQSLSQTPAQTQSLSQTPTQTQSQIMSQSQTPTQTQSLSQTLTFAPTPIPTSVPSGAPTQSGVPTMAPSFVQEAVPTMISIGSAQSAMFTVDPSSQPTLIPTVEPTPVPTLALAPTPVPTAATLSPTPSLPIVKPSASPTDPPTLIPSASPSDSTAALAAHSASANSSQSLSTGTVAGVCLAVVLIIALVVFFAVRALRKSAVASNAALRISSFGHSDIYGPGAPAPSLRASIGPPGFIPHIDRDRRTSRLLNRQPQAQQSYAIELPARHNSALPPLHQTTTNAMHSPSAKYTKPRVNPNA